MSLKRAKNFSTGINVILKQSQNFSSGFKICTCFALHAICFSEHCTDTTITLPLPRSTSARLPRPASSYHRSTVSISLTPRSLTPRPYSGQDHRGRQDKLIHSEESPLNKTPRASASKHGSKYCFRLPKVISIRRFSKFLRHSKSFFTRKTFFYTLLLIITIALEIAYTSQFYPYSTLCLSW